jgi:DNA repair ATPase RecN
MEFTLGDIIVFVAVAVMLVIYRQLDKNNQSLSKVRRFADKITKDLDGFVQSKTEDLKNLTIELDVHLKTAREILKRVSTIEDDLRNRTKGVDEISERIADYDKALGGLVTMTQKVDENLTRLHSESQFVDTVGRRVKDAIVQMNQIEKSLPALRAQFSRENAEQLKGLTGEVVRATEELVGSITDEVARAQDAVNDFSAHTAELESKRDSMEEETVNNLRNRFQELIVEADDSRGRMLSQFTNDLSLVLEREEEKGRDLVDEIKRRHEALGSEVDSTQELIGEKLDAFQDRIIRIEDDYQRVLREAAEKGRSLEDEVFIKLKDHIEARARSVENGLTGTMNESRERLETSRKELVEMFGETRSQITVWRAELQKKVDESVMGFESRYTGFSREVGQRMETILEDTGRSQAEQRQELAEFVAATRTEIETFEGTVMERVSALKESIADGEREFLAAMEVSKTESRDRIEKVRVTMEDQVSQFEERLNDRFQGLETRSIEYEQSMQYRFDKLEDVHTDIEALEETLKKHMDLAVSRAKDALGAALERIADDRALEKQRADEQLSEIRSSMGAIDGELTELKSKAYANVSAKLQIFEDDFFADLKGRNDLMLGRVDEWQAGMETRFRDVSNEQTASRAEAEQRFTDDLKAKLAGLQREMVDQYERFDTQVAEFQSRLESRVEGAEGSLEGLEATIRSDMADLRRASNATMEAELTELSSRMSDELKEHQHEVDSSLRILGERVQERGARISGMLESAQTDVTNWQEQVLLDMQETKNTVDEDLDSLRETVQSQSGAIVSKAETENQEMRAELADTRDLVAGAKEQLSAMSRTYIDEFTGNADAFLASFQRNAAELQSSADESVRDFKAQVADTRDRIETVQRRLQQKIDDGHKKLSTNLEGIERKQRDFVGQTKLFERADTLKDTLQKNVETLKADISRIDDHRSDLRDIEKEFNRIRKLGEDVSQKVAKFLAEKRRVDAMDEDFKRLINISQSIDMKLEQVTSSHDTIQDIQASVRGLAGLEAEVSERFERLESRKKIIDSTTDGVDRNFQKLEDLQGRIKQVEEELTPVASRLDGIGGRLDSLDSGKPEAEKVISLLTGLDTTLKDVEERIETMQQARDWLARTETRLSEVSKQAEDQVKLMGSLLKEGDKQGRQEKGAPSLSARDMVVRLAHQGWKIEQIVQATKLSRGEVELTLELNTRK